MLTLDRVILERRQVMIVYGDRESNAVRVELYVDGINGETSVRQEMKRVRQLVSALSGYV